MRLPYNTLDRALNSHFPSECASEFLRIKFGTSLPR
jgi:hypothetical protein